MNCMFEVWDNKSGKWLGKEIEFNHDLLNIRDFLGGYDCNYIFKGSVELPQPKTICNVNEGSALLFKLQNLIDVDSNIHLYSQFQFFKLEEIRTLIDILSKEYYTKELYTKVIELNKLREKAEIIDFVKKSIDNATDLETLKRLIQNAEDEINGYYNVNELEDTYSSMYYLIQDFSAIYNNIIKCYIINKDNKICHINELKQTDWMNLDYTTIDTDKMIRVIFYV